MKFTYFFVGLMIILMCCLPVNAANETILIQKVTMTIYGDGYYINNMPLPAGTTIIAKDQFKSIIGTYTIREIGRIGKEYGNDQFEIGVWRNQSDKANRTMPIFIMFFIGGIPTKNTLDFKQNENVNFNIVSRSLPTDPTIIETTTPTLTSKPQTTSTPSSVRTLPTAPIVVGITTVPEPITPGQPTVTEITTNQPIQTQPPQTTKPIPQQPVETVNNSREWIYYGIITTIVIVVGILVVGVIASYVYNKSSRDDVMQQDGTWNKK